MTEPPSREEFHMLRQAVAEQARRLEQTQTTANGIQVLSAQLAEVIKDVGAHEKRHDLEAASRISARRWAVGTGLVGLASIWAPLVYLISHVH